MQYDMAGISVMLAMPTHRDIPAETVRSLLETQLACQQAGIDLHVQFQIGSSLVQAARTKIAHLFLESECNRLFWIDSDIAWKPASFIRLLAFSTRLDVVGAAYPAKRDPLTFFVGVDDAGTLASNEHGCIPLSGMGLGFCCVQRRVMETLAAQAPLLRYPDTPEPIPRVFRVDDDRGLFRGEDMAFFADVRAAGFGVWADPTIRLGHIGAKTYEGALIEHLAKVAD